MANKCKNCGKEFEAKRKTAKYCSAKCRKLAFHKVSVLSVPSVSVPINPTVAEVMAMDKYQVKVLLDSWARGKGDDYQYNLAQIGEFYRWPDGEYWLKPPYKVRNRQAQETEKQVANV